MNNISAEKKSRINKSCLNKSRKSKFTQNLFGMKEQIKHSAFGSCFCLIVFRAQTTHEPRHRHTFITVTVAISVRLRHLFFHFKFGAAERFPAFGQYFHNISKMSCTLHIHCLFIISTCCKLSHQSIFFLQFFVWLG